MRGSKSFSRVPDSNPRRNCSLPTPDLSPTKTVAPGSADTICHISVLPCPPAAFSWTDAYASSGCTWIESLSVGKINFTSNGKSGLEASLLPRHSADISRQASPSVFPANGPLEMRQSTPVSQASPSGSVRFVLSGNRGARDLAPQIRGLKMGSIRRGSGFSGETLTFQAAASTRVKKRSRRRSPSSMRSMDVA